MILDRNYVSNPNGLTHVCDARWRGRKLLFREITTRQKDSSGSGAFVDATSIHVLGFYKNHRSAGKKIVYDFSPIEKKKQKNCRAFLRGEEDFRRHYSSRIEVSFAAGYEIVYTLLGPKQRRVN